MYFEATCDICGHTSVADLKTASANWDPHKRVVHRNPDDCIYWLNRDKEKAIG